LRFFDGISGHFRTVSKGFGTQTEKWLKVLQYLMAKMGGQNWYQSIPPIKLSGRQVFSFAILMRQYHERNIKSLKRLSNIYWSND
jgi:hypothetical protein